MLVADKTGIDFIIFLDIFFFNFTAEIKCYLLDKIFEMTYRIMGWVKNILDPLNRMGPYYSIYSNSKSTVFHPI